MRLIHVLRRFLLELLQLAAHAHTNISPTQLDVRDLVNQLRRRDLSRFHEIQAIVDALKAAPHVRNRIGSGSEFRDETEAVLAQLDLEAPVPSGRRGGFVQE